MDGKKGVLRANAQSCLDVIGLGTYIRGLRWIPLKALQVWAGKIPSSRTWRRFTAIASGVQEQKMTVKLAQGMLIIEALLPIAQCNLRSNRGPSGHVL